MTILPCILPLPGSGSQEYHTQVREKRTDRSHPGLAVLTSLNHTKLWLAVGGNRLNYAAEKQYNIISRVSGCFVKRSLVYSQLNIMSKQAFQWPRQEQNMTYSYAKAGQLHLLPLFTLFLQFYLSVVPRAIR